MELDQKKGELTNNVYEGVIWHLSIVCVLRLNCYACAEDPATKPSRKKSTKRMSTCTSAVRTECGEFKY